MKYHYSDDGDSELGQKRLNLACSQVQKNMVHNINLKPADALVLLLKILVGMIMEKKMVINRHIQVAVNLKIQNDVNYSYHLLA